MKQFIPLSFLIVLMGACQPSGEDKVKSAIKKHIRKNTDDNTNYEPVKFGELDSVYLKLEDTEKFNRLSDTSRLAGKIAGMRIRVKTAPEDQKAEDKEELEKLKNNMKQRRNKLKEYVNNYEPRLKGFHLPHTYKLDTKEITHTFEVDTNYQVVDTVK